uniref:Putative ankyrin repeat protein n=1 Tax=Moumouvirus sp. 'Monve' TaxID=1128131 RepID=H2EE33_9VIRU|nr:putative ankyrin repeat protein [Moumouvirus Monve]
MSDKIINEGKYFKIINEEWNHHGFHYKLGTNVLLESFNEDESVLCGPGGLYFINFDKIKNYYSFGTNLAVISLPENDPDLKILFLDEKMRANKINIDQVFSLFDINTYLKFGLNIRHNKYIIYFAVKYKNYNFLNWWLNSGITLYYDKNICELIFENNYLDILQWWIKSNKKLPKITDEFYTASLLGHIDVLKCCVENNLLTKNKFKRRDIIKKSIVTCFCSGNIQILDFLKIHFCEYFKEIHIDSYDHCKHLLVLEWWKNNGGVIWLENIIKTASEKNDIRLLNWLKDNVTICFGIDYNKNLIDSLSNKGNIKMLNWWKDSGLKFKYSVNAIDNTDDISCDDPVEVLDWWKKSGLKLKYTGKSVDKASRYDNIMVLYWWKNSGLEIKYTHKAIDKASEYMHMNILNWWISSGLELKYSEKTMDKASRHGFISLLNWWKESGLKLKYSEKSLLKASKNRDIKVLNWWLNSGLGLYCPDYINEFEYSSEIMDWWVNSNLVEIKRDFYD